MINTITLPPFKKMCVTIGNLPSSFMESMTYYEALCWLYDYFEKTLLPAINTNSEAITELQNAFTTLKQYIDNYFDNLDVQTEINNKLDDMAESGQLEEIIAAYLGSAGVLSFNTLNDMKTAENLIDGSSAKTLGYYNINDGGGAYYKIRTITNDDVVDESFIIELADNSLIAELIIDDVINVKQLGANSGVTNNSTFIQKALNKGGVIYIPEGNYPVTETINIGSNVKEIKMDNNTKILATANISDIFKLTATFIDDLLITGGIIDCDNKADIGINLYGNAYGFDINTLKVKNAKVTGISVGKSDSTNVSIHGNINKVKVYNNDTLATGISIYAHDIIVNDTEIFYTNKGIYNTGNTQFFTNVHIWNGGNTNTNNNTIGIDSTGSNMFVTNCYFDAMNDAIKCSTGFLTITNTYFYYPSDGTYLNPTCLYIGNDCYVRLSNYTVNKASAVNVALIDYIDTINWSRLSDFNHSIDYYNPGTFQTLFNNDKVDFGGNFNILDNKQCFIFSAGATLQPSKYYLIGYAILANSRGGNKIAFNLDAQNIGVSRTLQIAFDNNASNVLTATATSNVANFSNTETRYPISLGQVISVSTSKGNTVKAIPIYYSLGARTTALTLANGMTVSGFDKNRNDGCLIFFRGVEKSTANIWQDYYIS